MNVAIIPARGGSRRIARKNIRSFCGRPIIAYVIETASSSGCFDRVVVSTDDEEIAEFTERCDFMRLIVESRDVPCDELLAASIRLAMAARPKQMLAKPGMGFDEGFTTVKNEMRRIQAVLSSR